MTQDHKEKKIVMSFRRRQSSKKHMLVQRKLLANSADVMLIR